MTWNQVAPYVKLAALLAIMLVSAITKIKNRR